MPVLSGVEVYREPDYTETSSQQTPSRYKFKIATALLNSLDLTPRPVSSSVFRQSGAPLKNACTERRRSISRTECFLCVAKRNIKNACTERRRSVSRTFLSVRVFFNGAIAKLKNACTERRRSISRTLCQFECFLCVAKRNIKNVSRT